MTSKPEKSGTGKSGLWLPVLTASLFAFAFVTVGLAVYVLFGSPDNPSAELSFNRQSFTLVSHNGDPVTAETFTGKPSAVFFGYTHCPEVCPTTLMDMTDIVEAMGDKAENARFVFVSLDPERDTREILAQYMTSFAPEIMGVTGKPEEIESLAKGLKVFYRKVGEGEAYDLDHMSWIYLFDSDGNFVRTASLNNPNENLAEALTALMR